MLKQLLLISNLIICVISSSGQGGDDAYRDRIVKLNQLDKLDELVYVKLKDFRLLMIGEMHGTNEPAEFVMGLAELFNLHGDSVQVGFEIPTEKMTYYAEKLTDSSVLLSEFFSKPSDDGRASLAWATAIARMTKNSRVEIFFYDINSTDSVDLIARDSLMYLKLKKRLSDHPHWRTITLSGNIHNMRLPIKEQPTMAYYLCNDRELRIADSMCSLYHFYQSGTMLNNSGNGLELQKVNNGTLEFMEDIKFEKFMYIDLIPDVYDGFIFTRFVTASEQTSTRYNRSR